MAPILISGVKNTASIRYSRDLALSFFSEKVSFFSEKVPEKKDRRFSFFLKIGNIVGLKMQDIVRKWWFPPLRTQIRPIGSLGRQKMLKTVFCIFFLGNIPIYTKRCRFFFKSTVEN